MTTTTTTTTTTVRWAAHTRKLHDQGVRGMGMGRLSSVYLCIPACLCDKGSRDRQYLGEAPAPQPTPDGEKKEELL